MSTRNTGHPVRVLIVDDTPDLRDRLRLALEGDGYDVVGEAGDGRQGIEVAQRLLPDVILLDLAMPVMDGLEALPTLRRVCPDAKIIVLPGFGAAQMTRRGLAAGADGYLQKSVPLKTILGYVRDLTDKTTTPPSLSAATDSCPSRTAVAPVAATPELPDAVRLAPYGVIELIDEPVHRVVSANRAALELMGHPCAKGTPLFSTTPGLASMVTLHRAEDEAVFETDLPGGRATAALRRTGQGRTFLYLLPARLLDRVAEDLLISAQAPRGQLRVVSEAVDPATLLRPLVDTVDGARLEVEDHRVLLADPQRLEQMVANLLGNAQKHGRPPYSLVVRAAVDPHAVCIDVADRGPGVPPGLVDRLFQELTRAEGTDASGTGPGLYVVRTLATAQGGTVGYAPRPGGGAVFTLTLPARSR